MSISIDPEEILQTFEADESMGWCLTCGEPSPAEPDASGIYCQSCGALDVVGALNIDDLIGVVGAMELLIRGHEHRNDGKCVDCGAPERDCYCDED